MSAQLTIGINERGEKVNIEDAHNCVCFCPICHHRLIARNRIPLELAKREHHFAHEKGCLCEANDETVLHQMAKDIIIEEKTLMLPPSEDDSRPSGLVHFATVEKEKRDNIYGFRPDVDAITEKGERILIEFYVSHKVSSKKRNVIISSKLNCIEIDLNYVEIDKNVVRSFLLNDTDNREWVEETEKKFGTGDGNSFYMRNPLHLKAVDYIRQLFDDGKLCVASMLGQSYNLKQLGYDICEPSKMYRKFKSDLLLFRSKKNEKGYISISLRGRRRNEGHKTPRNLRVIDIIIRTEREYNLLVESATLCEDRHSIIFEGFNFKDEHIGYYTQQREKSDESFSTLYDYYQ